MSSRKHRRGSRKRSLRFKLLVCTCLILGPALVGGTCATFSRRIPRHEVFGAPRTEQARDDGLAAMVRSASIGATAGVLATIAYLWFGRPTNRWTTTKVRD